MAPLLRQRPPTTGLITWANDQAFLEATVYAANSYFYGDNNYIPYSEKSYERFIEEHPESVFAEYAFYNLIDAVYHYGGTKTIPQNIHQQKLKEFLTEKEFRLSNLKVKKAKRFHHVVGRAENIDKSKVIEQEPETLKNEDPVLSESLIRESIDKHKVKGLKNKSRRK